MNQEILNELNQTVKSLKSASFQAQVRIRKFTSVNSIVLGLPFSRRAFC